MTILILLIAQLIQMTLTSSTTKPGTRNWRKKSNLTPTLTNWYSTLTLRPNTPRWIEMINNRVLKSTWAMLINNGWRREESLTVNMKIPCTASLWTSISWQSNKIRYNHWSTNSTGWPRIPIPAWTRWTAICNKFSTI